MDIIETKLSWLLSVADRVKSIFASTAESDTIGNIIQSIADRNNALVAQNMVASNGYTFMIISADPHQLFLDIIDNIKSTQNTTYQEELNPINILVKLIDSEYMLDVGGTRLCYGVTSPIPSNYLMKIFACKAISSVRSYNNFIDQTSFVLSKDTERELHPLFDYRTNTNQLIGGKKRTFASNKKHTRDQNHHGRERIDIIAQLIEYVRNSKNISSGIIFVEELADCSSSAINILYTEYKYKEAITDFLKILIAKRYPNYSFKSFLHSDFSIPYDFRLKKYSCLVNDKATQKPTYIANIYNAATYNVIPCTRSIINDTSLIIAHPIIKLWVLYIDMYMIERKLGKIHPITHETMHMDKMIKAFDDLQTYDKYPTWVGMFIDEAYDKLQFNMRMKLSNPIDILYI